MMRAQIEGKLVQKLCFRLSHIIEEIFFNEHPFNLKMFYIGIYGKIRLKILQQSSELGKMFLNHRNIKKITF